MYIMEDEANSIVDIAEEDCFICLFVMKRAQPPWEEEDS